MERVLRIEEAAYGQDDVRLTKTQTSLGSAQGYLVHFDEKRKTLEHALHKKEANLDTDSVELIETLNKLANAYGALGDPRMK